MYNVSASLSFFPRSLYIYNYTYNYFKINNKRIEKCSLEHVKNVI